MEKNQKTVKRSLGRGIGALIPQEIPQELYQKDSTVENLSQDITREIIEVDLDKITPNPFQPRLYFDEQKIQELANSIKNYGVLEPILVVEANDGLYTIIAGERRFRAAQLAKTKTIPSIVLTLTDEEKIEIAIIENLQRENLNPIEMALSFKDIMSLNKITQEELSKKLGISRPVVSNYIRLLTLSDEIQKAIKEEKITQSHARLLLSIESETQRNTVFKELVKENLSVKSLEDKITKTKPSKNKTKELSIYEQKLIEFFGTKVSLNGTLKKGTITINYFNEKDFSRIIKLLKITMD